jgi:hypothetical protein
MVRTTFRPFATPSVLVNCVHSQQRPRNTARTLAGESDRGSLPITSLAGMIN